MKTVPQPFLFPMIGMIVGLATTAAATTVASESKTGVAEAYAAIDTSSHGCASILAVRPRGGCGRRRSRTSGLEEGQQILVDLVQSWRVADEHPLQYPLVPTGRQTRAGQ